MPDEPKTISEMKSETILEMNKWSEKAGDRIRALEVSLALALKQVDDTQQLYADTCKEIAELEADGKRLKKLLNKLALKDENTTSNY